MHACGNKHCPVLLSCLDVANCSRNIFFVTWRQVTSSNSREINSISSLCVTVLTSLNLLRRRQEVFSFRKNSNTTHRKGNLGGLTSWQFMRLLALASVDSLFTLPLSIAAIVLNLIESPLSPWMGLADAHFNFSKVDQVPAVEWKLNRIVRISFTCDRVFILLCAGVFVSFFSFAEESRKWWNEQLFRPCVKRLRLPTGRKRLNRADFSLPMTEFQKGLVVSVDVSVKRDTFSFGFGRKQREPSSRRTSISGDFLPSFWEEDERRPSKNLFESIRTKPLPLLP